MKPISGENPQAPSQIGFTRERPAATTPQKRRGAHSLLAAALFTGTLLAGCSSTPAPTPTPTQTISALQATSNAELTDEDILLLSENMITRYADVATSVTNNGGFGVEQFESFVSEKQYQQELDTAIFMAENGYFTIGSMSTYDFDLGMTVARDGYLMASVEFCSDASGIRFYDDEGNDVTSSDRIDFQLLTALVQFQDGKPTVYSIEPGETPRSCE